jgi:HemY protein
MIRAAFLIILAAAIAATLFGLAGEPGRATLEWLGWRVSMTAAAAVCAMLILAFLAVGLWRLGLWILETPHRNAAAQAASRRQQGTEALTRGFLAAAAGDGSQARRLARLAADLASDMPGLTRVLAAQAAEAAGDAAAAQAAYTAMLSFPEMRLAGHRGLMMTALAAGDRPAALAQARAAFSLPHTARWAWRALLEDRLEAGDWPAALDLVQRGVDHKVVSPISADRARCALSAASAASLELSDERKKRAEALEFASQAVKLDPGFTPGVVIAARLMAADRKAARATPLIEQAWKLSPHPALWLLWRDLKTAETPKERAARFAALAALNPAHRESRFVKVEEALLLRDPAAARAIAQPLAGAEPSARVCGLMARVANLAGDPDEARAWMARGVGARQEPAWTDIDPKGRAFAYGAADWARLCATFSETGELIHPRLARGEPVMTELPELPTAYETPSPYLEAAALGIGRPADDPGDSDGAGLIDASGFGGEGFDGPDWEADLGDSSPPAPRPVLTVVPSTPPPPRRPRRRLASPPSPAK